MTHKLSNGSLETIMKGGTVEHPLMQILGSKKMSSGSSADRYRLLISDGTHVNSFAMLATQLNEKVERGELEEFTIVKVNRFITSMVNNSAKGDPGTFRRVMIVLDVDIISPGSKVGMRIGEPVPIEEQITSGNSATSTANQRIQPAPSPTILSSSNGSAYKENRSSSIASSPGTEGATHPIASLNPYQNRWTVKARCTAKTSVKSWSNSRSEGKLFSMDLLDESGEIRCTAFKDAVDKYFDMIEIGNVYLISNCTLKAANKQYTQIKHDYEMTVNNQTIIVPCNDDVASIPKITFDFTTIDKIENLEDGACLDVIGICKESGMAATIVAKTTGKEFTKREITLVDETSSSVSVTLWGDQATNFEGSDQPVVVIKNVRLKIFNGGKTLGAQSSSTLLVNPDIQQAHRLRGWYENVGATQEYTSMSTRVGAVGGNDNNFITFGQMKERQLGMGDKADYVSVKATIITTKHDKALYRACPQTDCNKKVIDVNNGMYRCEKHNLESENFKWRLLTFLNLGDHTTNQFATGFQESAEIILMKTAEELGEMQMSDPTQYQEIFNEANFKSYIFRLRVKMESYNDNNQLKVNVAAVQPINHKVYNAHLIKEIKRMLKMEKPTS